jgi:hypothetical protein
VTNVFRSCKRRAGALLLAVLPLPTPTHPEIVPPQCAIALDVRAEPPMTWGERALRALTLEVDRIWHPYGIRLCWAGLSEDCDGWHARLQVLIASDPARIQAAQGRPILGSIPFDDRGPRPDITLSVATARRLVRNARLSDTALDTWPDAAVDALLPRVLARGLAHEIGHYLLRSRSHAREGLMAAGFRPDDVTFGTTARFRLAEPEASAVRQQCLAPGSTVLGG